MSLSTSEVPKHVAETLSVLLHHHFSVCNSDMLRFYMNLANSEPQKSHVLLASAEASHIQSILPDAARYWRQVCHAQLPAVMAYAPELHPT